MSAKRQIIIEFDETDTLNVEFKNNEGLSGKRTIEVLAAACAGVLESLAKGNKSTHEQAQYLFLQDFLQDPEITNLEEEE